MMHWTIEANKTLLQLFNEGHTDEEMAAHFGIGVMALAKQRSRTGLIYHKRQNRLKRAKSPQSKIIDKAEHYALSYTKDNITHFSNLGKTSLQKAVQTAVRFIHANKIKDVVVLKSCGTIHNGSLKYKQFN